MRRSAWTLLALGAIGGQAAIAATASQPFKPMPLRTPEQQAMMNGFGNLAVTKTLYDRCLPSFDPTPTEAQKTAMLAYADRTQAGAMGALHEAYPLDPPEEFTSYLIAYKRKVVEAVNTAIDHNGCEDPNVQRSIELLNRLHRGIPATTATGN